MPEWDEYVGRDPWKNLIAEECRSAGRQAKGSEDARPGFEHGLSPESVAENEIGEPPNHSALAYYCLTGAKTAPWKASWLVFHAGRYFLVGAQKHSIDRLSCLRKEHPLRHLHVVLLSWQKEHRTGLLKLINDPKQPLTIWTSRWIWDECCKQENEFRGHKLRVTPSESERVESILDPRDLKGEPTKGEPTVHKVRTFEETLDVSFTLGVRMQMRYTMSHPQPSLMAVFSCAGQKFLGTKELQDTALPICIDPFRSAANPDDLALSLKHSIQNWPQLKPDFAKREEQLKEIAALKHCSWKLGWSPSDGGDGDIDLRMWGKVLEEVRLRPPEAKAKPKTVPTAEPSDASVVPKVGVVLLCGALLRRDRSELIDSGRALRIDLRNSNRIVILSILEWRLRQILALFGEQTQIFLKTTPDTEPIIDSVLRRLKSNFPDASIRKISSWLTPYYCTDTLGKLQPFETEDGGWILTLGGHVSGMQILNGIPDLPPILMVFAHNNLGAILSEGTKKKADQAYKSGAAVTVELFEMRRGERPDDRWQCFSYLKGGEETGFLWKAEYGDADDAKDPDTFSSMTYYLRTSHLKKIIGPDLRRKPDDGPIPRWVVSTVDVQGEEIHALRQDIDLITHQSDVRYDVTPEKADGPSGIYAHSRFFSVRKEDHLRDSKFWPAFSKSQKAGVRIELQEEISDELIKQRRLWELIPVEKQYVWGGTQIAKMKGAFHYWDHTIAETWELSTHPSGTASCLLDIRRSVPFSEVFRTYTEKADCPFMAKYLDCHQRLSIQVHPNDSVAQFLAESTHLKISDDQGKEETFYVIEPAADRLFQLILGFSEERLENLAALIRPRLQELWYTPETTSNGTDERKFSDKIYPELLKAMKSAANEMIKSVLKALGEKVEISTRLVRTFETNWEAQNNDDPLGFRGVLHWHLIDHPQKAHSEGLPWSLLGREYLFAALVVVRVIQELALYGRNKGEASDDIKTLFDCPERFVSATDKRNSPKEHSIFKFFETKRLKKGAWVRVPAGIVHSWQGGGNSLIEIADRSDNTFRILDYGRELDSRTLREMHYTQAMYAITDDSIVSKAAIKRLILSPNQERGRDSHDSDFSQLHARVEHREMRREGQIESDQYAAVLNPEGAVELRSGAEILRVPPASAVFIADHKSGTTILRPGQSGLVIALRPRKAHSPVICVSFGAGRVELAAWDPAESPQMRWLHSALISSPKSPADTIDNIKDLAKRLQFNKANPAVGICWPGPVNLQSGTCYSSAFGGKRFEIEEVKTAVLQGLGMLDENSSPNVLPVANDAFLSAHGERRHPRGRDPGGKYLILNLGTGICAGWLTGDAQFEPLGYLGRWLYVDSITSEFWINGPKPIRLRKDRDNLERFDEVKECESLIAGAVFKEDLKDDLKDPAALRGSIYFSFGGVVLRWLDRLRNAEKEEFLKDMGGPMRGRHTSTDGFVNKAKEVTENPQKYPRFTFIRSFNAALSKEDHSAYRAAYAFMADYAFDLARCVKVLESGRPNQKRFPGVILTGSLGENLGRREDNDRDVLVELMSRFLPGRKVVRSRMGTSVLRELAGVVALAESTSEKF